MIDLFKLSLQLTKLASPIEIKVIQILLHFTHDNPSILDINFATSSWHDMSRDTKIPLLQGRVHEDHRNCFYLHLLETFVKAHTQANPHWFCLAARLDERVLIFSPPCSISPPNLIFKILRTNSLLCKMDSKDLATIKLEY